MAWRRWDPICRAVAGSGIAAMFCRSRVGEVGEAHAHVEDRDIISYGGAEKHALLPGVGHEGQGEPLPACGIDAG
jgi:hypothetical protein